MMNLQDEEAAASIWLKEMQKGYIRIATLILLSKKPYHGYELMKQIKKETGGFWKPTSGGIYPILQNLEDAGYIQGEWDRKSRRKKKVYTLTKIGQNVLKHALTKERQLANTMRKLFEEYMKDVLEMDTQSDLTLRIPTPLSQLFIEIDENEELKIKRLENQSKQIQSIIKQLQKRLRTINKRLYTLNRTVY